MAIKKSQAWKQPTVAIIWTIVALWTAYSAHLSKCGLLDLLVCGLALYRVGSEHNHILELDILNFVGLYMHCIY